MRQGRAPPDPTQDQNQDQDQDRKSGITMNQQGLRLAPNMTWGAVAGMAATFALSGVTQALYARESTPNRLREIWARKGKSANRVAVDRLADAAGVSLSTAQTEAAEGVLHFGIGAGSGAVYAAVRPHIPVSPVVKGLGFGASLWLVADEGINPALGLAAGPAGYPWQAHARGLAAHLTFGLATEAILTLTDHFRGRRGA